MQMRGILVLFGAAFSLVRAVDDPAKSAAESSEKFVLFRSANMASPDELTSGDTPIGFHSFRIPAVVRTTTGTILAFAEGRRHNNKDYGDINLVYKRTKSPTNNGNASSDWSELREVWGVGAGTWGNPTAVVDGGTIYLFMSWNAATVSQFGDPLYDGTPTTKINSTWEFRRHLYLTNSTDDGKTWSNPVDMTTTLTPDGWGWDAVGPGIGITLTTGELVVPAKGRNIVGHGPVGSRTSWSYQLLTGAGSEGAVAQTFDGNLYRNDRPSDPGHRIVARGTLQSFGSFAEDSGLPDPQCEGSLLLYNQASAAGPARLIFLNAANTTKDNDDFMGRRPMRVRITYDDDAAKFDFGRKLSDDALSPATAGYEGGYSSMCKTADAKIGALVETNFNDKPDSHRAIIWRRFNLSWILNGPQN
ncbi:neuraminidase [Thozetella sp. PMI_491]|nr:neuraminidase [Thozetella sp. PMI_491]